MKNISIFTLFVLFHGSLLGQTKEPEVKLYPFEKMPNEQLSDKISRRYVYGEKEMLVRFELKKGAIIPEHHHPSEQITYILSGAVKVTIQGKDYFVRKGEVLIIPPNVPHKFEALEDTIDIDVFSPPREDWIKGTDTYLKQK
jgi:quercetin dioxygenase-like cupin family protein